MTYIKTENNFISTDMLLFLYMCANVLYGVYTIASELILNSFPWVVAVNMIFAALMIYSYIVLRQKAVLQVGIIIQVFALIAVSLVRAII